ncbi:aryl-sulfate sulfotransferase [Winogradskyella aquimaris]|uniref:Aryl-sulfate sulfotransferase n=1 Tax=Winogradskyella aquimaris TaxID=864074 RepID=A0ABU5EMH7_9FLAO|nr:aryl-sulfate sulfotransferase [Winogradskyella aquimaris]MDY2587473.1 aryl-sulfate sulfotransferase [Winogradskyella aquimaris]
MIKRLLLFAVIISNISVSQNTIGTTFISEGVYDGYTLFTVSTETYLINNCGEVINQWTSTFPPGNSVYLLENGNLLRAGRTSSSDITFGGQGGVVELYNWDGNLIWQYFYDTPMMRQHHDVYPMPNGNILILAATVMSNSEAIQAGRDPLLLTETDLYNEQIIEVTPLGLDSVNIVWEWNIKDHLIQDFDATKDNFGNIGLNPNKLDINFLNGGSGGSNWLHINSIQYNEERDQIILSSRNLSEIWIIDHSTTTAEAASDTGGTYGKGGDLLYRWGNPEAYKQGTNADRTLFGQHTPYFIPSNLPNSGKILLFNNGIDRTPSYSQVDIISPPETSLGVYDYSQNTKYLPNNTDYTYDEFTTGNSDFFSPIVSSARQLPNGNILICEGNQGHFFEINSNEEKVWEYVNPVNSNNGNISSQGDPPPNANLTFRAEKYPTNYAAFDGRDLTPGDPIELNPDLTLCNSLSVSEFEIHPISIYPNPTNGSFKVSSTQNINKIEVYNILGKRVLVSSGTTIDLSFQSSGVYLIKIHSDKNSITKKVVKN